MHIPRWCLQTNHTMQMYKLLYYSFEYPSQPKRVLLSQITCPNKLINTQPLKKYIHDKVASIICCKCCISLQGQHFQTPCKISKLIPAELLHNSVHPSLMNAESNFLFDASHKTRGNVISGITTSMTGNLCRVNLTKIFFNS